jgi:hypothetical protein
VLLNALFDFLQGCQIPKDLDVSIGASALTYVLFTFCRNAGMAIEDIEKGLAQAAQNARDEVQ